MGQRGPLVLGLRKWPRITIDGDRFPLDDLGYLLRQAESVRELTLDGDQPVDLDVLHQLTQLEVLTLDAAAGEQPLEVRRFPHLHTLRLWSPVPIDWEGAPALEDVRLTEPSEADLAALSSLPALAVVHLEAPSRIPGFASPHLTHLVVRGCDDPLAEPISGLGAVTDLELAGLAAARDLSAFAGTAPLEWCGISGAPQLRSIASLRFAEGAELEISGCPRLADLGDVERARGVTVEIDGLLLP